MRALTVHSGGGVAQDVATALRLGWAEVEILQARTGPEAIEHVQRFAPDLVVVDTGLPDSDWLHLLREIRRLSEGVTIVLSRQLDEGELMAAVEAGADDYMRSPVKPTLFVARVRAALRRADRFAHGEEGLVTCGHLEMDPARHEAKVNGQCLRLTATEFKLLLFMARRGGRVAMRESLRTLIWGEDAEVYGPCLRKYIQHLRRRLEEVPGPRPFIVTLPKVGYKLVEDSIDAPPGFMPLSWGQRAARSSRSQ